MSDRQGDSYNFTGTRSCAVTELGQAKDGVFFPSFALLLSGLVQHHHQQQQNSWVIRLLLQCLMDPVSSFQKVRSGWELRMILAGECILARCTIWDKHTFKHVHAEPVNPSTVLHGKIKLILHYD